MEENLPANHLTDSLTFSDDRLVPIISSLSFAVPRVPDHLFFFSSFASSPHFFAMFLSVHSAALISRTCWETWDIIQSGAALDKSCREVALAVVTKSDKELRSEIDVVRHIIIRTPPWRLL